MRSFTCLSLYHSVFTPFVSFLRLNIIFHFILLMTISIFSINCNKYVSFCGIPMFFIEYSKNLAGFSFSVAHQITGHTDFLWKHFKKTLTWRHILHKIPWYCKFLRFIHLAEDCSRVSMKLYFPNKLFCLKTFEIFHRALFMKPSRKTSSQKSNMNN